MPQTKLSYNQNEIPNAPYEPHKGFNPYRTDINFTQRDRGKNSIFAKKGPKYAIRGKMQFSGESSNHLHQKVKLTKRETECLEWASEGKTSFEIATILGLSENTVNNYIASVVRKMGASNRLHMVGIALRENYID